ncbi:hypothetical protein CSQ92_18430 [Janthinobacterium sp. BJB446]|uniref:HNH endonuclease n=1 Tax=Janthinobacterium sp. BJB446 TaxID=2048009 RepID=UPI000C0F5205|nr:HNH endonuclease [Janthinobacterium sp. BJB446]PHV21327.1 hypothetical protein CSQ92_18430 [Janthinobacterium sp. BJB446]
MKREAKFINATNALGTLVVGDRKQRTGWPGIVTIQTPSGNESIALHVSSISSHSRKSYEKRFQNPADSVPVSDEKNTALPILIGLDNDENPTVFVAVDGRSRVGRIARFSILFHDSIIAEAKSKGWAVYESSTGESVYAFVPSLLPAFVEQLIHHEILTPNELSSTAAASGVLDTTNDNAETTQAANRASKAVNVLIRKAGAGRKIKSAYGNQCAMCGLALNLLEGAHVFPVEAAGSNDEIWNGISLCRNHHGAFDNHLLWIDPKSYEIKFHPNVHKEAKKNIGAKHLLESTNKSLTLPAKAIDLPRPEMFEKRYIYFSEHYTWVKAKP